jgi:hypothetical protein
LRRDATGKFPSLKLETGVPHRIVVVTGKPSPTITVPGTRFAYNSSFPAPSIAGALRFMIEAMDELPTAKATVFGHADSTGSDSFNKALSDRRASATLALLTDDLGRFTDVARAEQWPTSIYQAMLRALGPNPGPIDGQAGELTAKAVSGFREEYQRGVYHREANRAPAIELTDGDALDEDTKGALRDAYLAQFSTRISADRFAGPKFAGCSEFVPLSDNASDNRRVTLAVFREADIPPRSEFPCVEGNASACPLDQGSGRRCPFYRNRVSEPTDPEFAGDAIPFFDFQWLRASDTVTHLSAITAIADETPVKFRVLRAGENFGSVQVPDSEKSGSPPQVGTELVSIDGVIKNGIAFAKWEHAADEDPFATERWFINQEIDIVGLDDDEDASAVSARKLFDSHGFAPPLFELKAGGARGLSAPPGHALNRVAISESAGNGFAITSSGFLINFKAEGGRIDAPDDAIVIALATSEARLVDPESTAGAGEGPGEGD